MLCVLQWVLSKLSKAAMAAETRARLQLAQVVLVFPLQEIDFFQQLLFVELEFPHVHRLSSPGSDLCPTLAAAGVGDQALVKHIN